MKILVVCQYYYPEPFRHPDFCEELVKLGHEVDVVTGIPNYPMGEIYKGYEHNQKQDEVIHGVNVHRCYTIPRKNSTLYRFLNYYSYAISSTRYIKKLKKEYDVVFVDQLSPVMMACAGIKYKQLHSKKLVLYCLDLWPESLIAGSIKKDSLVYKIFFNISKRIYKQADTILVSSDSFRKYFKDNFNIDNTIYLPQYAEDIFDSKICKKQKDEYIDLMFAGNVGSAQGIETIIKAAELLKEQKQIRFHIVGDGKELDNIKKQASSLENVIFYGRKPLEEMPSMYSKADVMLITTKDSPVWSYTLPGKIQTYMAAGKPIIGAISGEGQRVINEAKCGLCGNAEDYKQLAENIKHLATLDLGQMAVNSREYYRNHFIKDNFINKLLTYLQ